MKKLCVFQKCFFIARLIDKGYGDLSEFLLRHANMFFELY